MAMTAKANLRNLLVVVTVLSALLLGCDGRPQQSRSYVTDSIRLTDIVQMNDEATPQVVTAIKQNMFYFRHDGLCFAALASLGSKAYPVIAITCVPCEKLEGIK
jgi:hypothetical protein